MCMDLFCGGQTIMQLADDVGTRVWTSLKGQPPLSFRHAHLTDAHGEMAEAGKDRKTLFQSQSKAIGLPD
jgi:hypothetical protein